MFQPDGRLVEPCFCLIATEITPCAREYGLKHFAHLAHLARVQLAPDTGLRHRVERKGRGYVLRSIGSASPTPSAEITSKQQGEPGGRNAMSLGP